MELTEMSFEKSLSKVRGWRMKYSAAEYPHKVVMNLFYQLKPTEILWSEIDSIFNQRNIFSNFDEAFNNILDKHRNIQFNIRPTFEQDLKRNPEIGNIDYNTYSQTASKAAYGDAKMVEELEYSYIWFSIRDTLMLAFLAYGLTGMTISQAYQKVCGIWINNASFSTYASAENAFHQEVSLFMKMNYVPNFK